MSPNPSNKCSRCGVVSPHLIHTVPHRGTFHRLCTSCVLLLHSHAFCPICFSLHTQTPPHTTPSCFKCSSIPHSYCMDPTPKTPYICPICINPKTPPFQDSKPIDLKAARVLLCAAKIVSALMRKAVVKARVKADMKAKAAILSRKKARIAAQVFDCVVAEANGDKLVLCDICDRGFHLSCVGPVFGSVPRGSWFCAECTALVQNKPDILTPNQTDVPDMDMAVGKQLLTEAMLRNITPPLYERARAGQSDKAEPIKKKEKIQSTTKRVSKSKLAGEPESEVKFEATVPEEEEINGNKEDLDGVDVRGERTEIPLNGGDEENEEGRVDPDALKKKEGKRRCFPSKEKVGGGHCHKKHNKSSSEGKKRSSKEANIGESLVAGSVKCAKDCRAHCKKAEAELKECEAQYDIMENQIKVAKRKVKDAKKQVHAAKKDAQNFAKDMKDSEDAVKKKEAELKTRNKEQEQ